MTYNLSVTTGDAERAETDAEIYCVLHGVKGDTGIRKLTQSNKEKPFCRGQVGDPRVSFYENVLINKKLQKLHVQLLRFMVFLIIYFRPTDSR